MPASAANPLQLDLPRHRCSHIVLFATVAPTPDRIESLRELVRSARQREDWPWAFAEPYRAGDESYLVEALLFPARQAGRLQVQVEFSSGGRVRRRVPSVLSLISVLSDPETPVDVDCVAHFDYREDEGVSVIPLPVGGPGNVALPEGDGKRFEVRGLRITQLDEEGSIDSSVIVDRPTNAEYHHTVAYKRLAVLSIDLPAQLLNRASEISQLFFRVKGSISSSKASPTSPSKRQP